jgi:cytochrome bd-type quinol oxidase subunit 2
MYRWWVLLHIVGVAGFLTAHGVSMYVLYQVRSVDLDRGRILGLLTFSGATTMPMYVSLLVLLVGGIAAGISGRWFSSWWIWVSLLVLLLTTAAMYLTAKPYFERLKAACEVRPSGVPRVSDEELGQILRGPATGTVSAIGSAGLLIILYLMVFKPGV